MAASERADAGAAATATRRVVLAPGDVDGALALSDAAGWNQTADDWALFIGAGTAIGERAPDGRLVATTATLRYGAAGWVSMVLVAETHRHAGLATALVETAVAALKADGVVPYLDATPAGRPVYEAAGFVPGFGFERWEGRGGSSGSRAGERTPDQERLDGLVDRDRRASGLERAVLIEAIASRPTSKVVVDGDAFAIVRAGRRAWQVGPLVAPDENAAIALLDRALDAVPGERVFIDVPTTRLGVVARLDARGFRRQRPFTRMAHGRPPAPCGRMQFAFVGPEFG